MALDNRHLPAASPQKFSAITAPAENLPLDFTVDAGEDFDESVVIRLLLSREQHDPGHFRTLAGQFLVPAVAGQHVPDAGRDVNRQQDHNHALDAVPQNRGRVQLVPLLVCSTHARPRQRLYRSFSIICQWTAKSALFVKFRGQRYNMNQSGICR